MHAALAPRLGIERAFEDGAEDGGGDSRPVEILARAAQEKVEEAFGEVGDFDGIVGEQAAVHVRERGEGFVHVGIAGVFRRVQDAEEVEDRSAGIARGEAFQIVAERAVGTEEPGVLGVEAEDDADAEDVEAFESVRVVRVFVLFEKFIVEQPDERSRLHGDFQFAADVGVLGVEEKIEAPGFFFEIFQEENFRGVFRAFEVVDVKFAEVADDDPARALGVGQFLGVALRLAERGEAGAVGLLVCLAQVDFPALLLDEHFRSREIRVDETRARKLHLFFEFDARRGISDAEHVAQKPDPKHRGFLFFVSAPLPRFREGLRRQSAFRVRHHGGRFNFARGRAARIFSPFPRRERGNGEKMTGI